MAVSSSDYFFFRKDFIYLFDRENKRAQTGRVTEVEGEEEPDFPLSREPNAGLHPRTLGS